jgi:hypothetical protein
MEPHVSTWHAKFNISIERSTTTFDLCSLHAFNTASNIWVSRFGKLDCGGGREPRSGALGFYLWVVLPWVHSE